MKMLPSASMIPSVHTYRELPSGSTGRRRVRNRMRTPQPAVATETKESMIAPAERSVHEPVSSLQTRQMSSQDVTTIATAETIAVTANTRPAISPSELISSRPVSARARSTGRACAPRPADARRHPLRQEPDDAEVLRRHDGPAPDHDATVGLDRHHASAALGRSRIGRQDEPVAAPEGRVELTARLVTGDEDLEPAREARHDQLLTRQGDVRAVELRGRLRDQDAVTAERRVGLAVRFEPDQGHARVTTDGHDLPIRAEIHTLRRIVDAAVHVHGDPAVAAEGSIQPATRRVSGECAPQVVACPRIRPSGHNEFAVRLQLDVLDAVVVAVEVRKHEAVPTAV